MGACFSKVEKVIRRAAELPSERLNILLPCFKSNNLGFEIFVFLETEKAIIILRSLSRKGMQFSFNFHKLAEPVRGLNLAKEPKLFKLLNPFAIPIELKINSNYL